MAIATIIAPMKGGTLFAAADRSFTGTNAYESLLLPSGRAGFFVADGPCARRVRGKRPRTAEAADRGIRRPCGVGERQAIKPTVKLYLSVANGRLFFVPLLPRRHRLLRPPHAGGASPFLRDQKRRQKSRRECDSPFSTPVGTENRTFPGREPLPEASAG